MSEWDTQRGGGQGSEASAWTRPPKPKRRWRRIALWVGGAVAVLLVLALILAPMVASRIAPGYIERAVDDAIPGSVEVRGLRLGWGGHTVVGPAVLFDDQGKRVGEVSADVPVGLWRIVTGRWWSRKRFDLGTVVIAADLDVVRGTDGTTNLERALGLDKPGKPSPKRKSGPAELPPGGIEEVRAVVRLDQVNATFTDHTAPAGSAAAQGLAVRGLVGDIAVDYTGSRRGLEVALKTDLQGTIRSGPGTGQAAGKQTILVNAKAELGRGYALKDADVTAKVGNLSTALVDLLGNFNGHLAATLGPTADLSLVAKGNAEQARAVLDFAAEGAAANVKLDYDGTRLALEEPGRVWVRDTGFIAGLDAAEPALQRAGELVRLANAPGVTVSLDALDVPLSAAQLTGGDLAGLLDLRGAKIGVTVRTDAAAGQVAIRPPAGAEGDAGAGGAGRWEPFEVQPLVVNLATEDLSQGIRLTADTAATIAGQNAGRLGVNVLAAGVLDGQGRPISGLPRINGEVRFTEIATRLVQPILEGMDLPVRLEEDVGPQLDVAVTAATSEGAAAPGGSGVASLPPTDITAHVASQNVNLSAALRVAAGAAQAAGDGIVLRIGSAGPLVRRLTAGNEGVAVGGKAGVEVSVRQMRLPIDGSAATLDGVFGDVRAEITDVAVEAEGQRIDVPRATIAALLPPNEGARATLDVRLAHVRNPFAVTGDLALPRLRQRWPLSEGTAPLEGLLRFEPRGRLRVEGAPGSLAVFVPALTGEPAGPADVQGHLTALARSLLGQRVDVSVEVAPDAAVAATDGPTPARITAGVYAASAAVEARAGLRPDALVLDQATALARLDPRDVDPVLAAISAEPGAAAPAGEPMRLAAPVTVRAEVEPVTVPLTRDATPDLSKLGEIAAVVSADEPLMIRNVAIGGVPDTVGVAGLRARATAPGGVAAASPAERSQMEISAEVGLNLLRQTDTGTQPLGTLSLTAGVPFDNAAKAMRIKSELKEISTAALDELLEQGGVLPGALGEQATVRVNMSRRTGYAMGLDTQVVAPRLLVKWTKLLIDDRTGKVRLAEPSEVTWTPDVAWLNAVAFAPAGVPARGDQVIGGPGGAAAQASAGAHLTEMAPVTLALDRFEAALPDAAAKPPTGPLRPGVFALNARATAPRLVMDPGDGRPAVTVQGITLETSNVPESSDVRFALRIAQVSGAGETSVMQGITGVVSRLADAAGNLTPDAAELTARGGVAGFPTALVDAVAQQGGLLTEALGPAVTLELRADRLSRHGGTIQADARSERATATLSGRIENNTFIQTGPTQITLLAITPRLVRELGGSLPLVATVEKTPRDEPGVVRMENISAPIDGDLSKLNGRVTVDPGVVNFTTHGGFASLLKLADQRQQGQLGRRLEPFVVNIRNGVASYDRFRLALGEFSVETSGSVDLVNGQMDIITYVPFFALTDEVAGALSTNLAGVLGALPGGIDRATMVPLRTRGSLSNPQTKVDADLFVKQFGETLLNTPGRILDDVLRGRLEDLVRPKK